jgi:hypothetical protein
VPAYDEEGFANATAFRLDKYQITSGRIRRFLAAVNGNVKGWVQANRANVLAPNQLPATLDPYLPTGWTQPNSGDTCYPEGTDEPSTTCNYGDYGNCTYVAACNNSFNHAVAPVWITSAALYGLPVAFMLMLALVVDSVATRRRPRRPAATIRARPLPSARCTRCLGQPGLR